MPTARSLPFGGRLCLRGLPDRHPPGQRPPSHVTCDTYIELSLICSGADGGLIVKVWPSQDLISELRDVKFTSKGKGEIHITVTLQSGRQLGYMVSSILYLHFKFI